MLVAGYKSKHALSRSSELFPQGAGVSTPQRTPLSLMQSLATPLTPLPSPFTVNGLAGVGGVRELEWRCSRHPGDKKQADWTSGGGR